MKQLIIYILILLTATSCGSSDEMGGTETGDVNLRFTLDIPQASEMETRASFDDKSIRNIDLLIFTSNKFKQRIPVNNVTGSGATKSFSVRLPASTEPCTIHIVANGRNANNEDVLTFNAITVGMLESDAKAKLETKLATSSSTPSLPLVMTGKTSLTNISTSTSVGTVSMQRMVAAIRVECAIRQFDLIGFSVQKASNKGLVIPTATTVNLPTAVGQIDYIAESGAGTWGNLQNELYIYERSNVLDNTGQSVVIHGKYNGVEGYYKLWLKNVSGKAVDMIRNHRYTIKITNVSGTGYLTAKEALAATHPSNISAQIIDDNDDITDIITDGKYELGISSKAISLPNTIGVHQVATVVNTNSSANLSATSDQTWLVDPIWSGSGTRKTLTFRVASKTTVARTATVVVRAGILNLKITVTQKAN